MRNLTRKYLSVLHEEITIIDKYISFHKTFCFASSQFCTFFRTTVIKKSYNQRDLTTLDTICGTRYVGHPVANSCLGQPHTNTELGIGRGMVHQNQYYAAGNRL